MPSPREPDARRLRLAAAVPVVAALGAALRFGLPEPAADVAGGVAYAVLVYLLAGVVRPTAAPRTLAVVSAAICAGVELAQLTSVPAELVDRWPPLRLALGRSFAVWDLPPYVVGAAAAALVDARARRGRRASG